MVLVDWLVAIVAALNKQTLTSALRGPTSLLLLHTGVEKRFERGVERVAVRGWFLSVFFLWEKLGSTCRAKAMLLAGAFDPFKIALDFVYRFTFRLPIVQEARPFWKAKKLLCGRVVAGVLTDLLAVSDTREHFFNGFLVILFYLAKK